VFGVAKFYIVSIEFDSTLPHLISQHSSFGFKVSFSLKIHFNLEFRFGPCRWIIEYYFLDPLDLI
jgi:hypothetical protein